MKIIMIRHGEPDYSKDALTEKGEREAACLAKWIRRIDPHPAACGSPSVDRSALLYASVDGGAAHLQHAGSLVHTQELSAAVCHCLPSLLCFVARYDTRSAKKI